MLEREGTQRYHGSCVIEEFLKPIMVGHTTHHGRPWRETTILLKLCYRDFPETDHGGLHDSPCMVDTMHGR